MHGPTAITFRRCKSRKLFTSILSSFASFENRYFSFLHSRSPLTRHKYLKNRFSIRQFMDLKSVIDVFEQEVPPYLSESWDNTGLLVEPPSTKEISTILFTNDLTEDVLAEALTVRAHLIISYHPLIFAPVKSLKNTNWKDHIIMKCIENSIAVYSPHTACDAVKGGVNDWLIKCFDLSEVQPIHHSYRSEMQYSHRINFSVPFNEEIEQILKPVSDAEIIVKSSDAKRKVLEGYVSQTSLTKVMEILTNNPAISHLTLSNLSPLPLPSYGMGRIGKMKQPTTINDCIKILKNYLKLNHIRISLGKSHTLETEVSVIAVCAGSGSSVLKGVKADLYITGEMSHHDLLDTKHRKVSVILCEHSNTERGYLEILKNNLSKKLCGINLIVSSSDEDPIKIV